MNTIDRDPIWRLTGGRPHTQRPDPDSFSKLTRRCTLILANLRPTTTQILQMAAAQIGTAATASAETCTTPLQPIY